MKAVAIVGKRGGSGKTSVSHLAALGAAWKMTPAYFMHTDDRDPIEVSGRPYAYYDARNPETLATLMGAAVNKDGLCVIDGGGNRPEFDKWIADCVDLAIIPVSPDPEDVREALQHYERLVKAGAVKVKYLINKYPSSKVERGYVDTAFLCDIPAKDIIGYLPMVAAVRTLRASDTEKFKTPPSKVNKVARQTYDLINKELGA
ncbi:hypothetical protein [Aquimarina macrocephali]|uniref:hypothetical protein n=1 Tax=Aquimarina macrocephali TaxID=666563 RepID=UPI00046368F0|nr:hypothetical protein [Aquimarina macrocephali]